MYFRNTDLNIFQRHNVLWFTVVYALGAGNDSSLPKLPVFLSAFSLQNDIFCRNEAINEKDVTQATTTLNK